MNTLTKESIQTALIQSGYRMGSSGRYQIPYPVETIEEDWIDILNDEETYPYFALRNYMESRQDDVYDDWKYHFYRKCFPCMDKFRYDSEHYQKFETLVDEMAELSLSIELIQKEVILTDIGVDTGDGDWEYTANTVPPAYNADHYLNDTEDTASIIWLTKQQGYTKGQLQFALRFYKRHSSLIDYDFTYRIAHEVFSTFVSMNQLFFLVKMTVEDILILNSVKKWSREKDKWGGYILITPQTRTGFYTPYLGGSSAMGIRLEKEVKLPIKYMACVSPDKAYGRDSVMNIFENEAIYQKGRITYMNLPRQFRKKMKEFGLQPIERNVRRDVDFSD